MITLSMRGNLGFHKIQAILHLFPLDGIDAASATIALGRLDRG